MHSYLSVLKIKDRKKKRKEKKGYSLPYHPNPAILVMYLLFILLTCLQIHVCDFISVSFVHLILYMVVYTLMSFLSSTYTQLVKLSSYR